MSSLQVHQPQQGALVAEQPFVPLTVGLTEENKLALLEYWRAIVRRKWAILALAVVVALVAGAVAFSLTPVYRSTVTVLIESGKAKVVSIDDVYSAATGQNKENYQTQVEIIKSREVAVRTAAALKLWNVPEFDPRKAKEGFGAKLRAAVGIKPEAVQWTEETLADAAGARLMEVMTVEPVRLSQLVKVSVESTDKVLAARLANAVADNYIDADRDARFKLTQQVNTWLQNRLGALRDKVVQADKALQDYREKQGLVSIGGSAQTMAGQTVADLNGRLSEARARRMQLEGAYQQIISIGSKGDLSSVPAVVGNYAVADAKRREGEVAQRVAEMSANYGPEHVRMQQAQAELKAAREALRAQTQSVVDSVMRDYNAALQTERSLEAALSGARGSVQAVNRQEFELAALERDAQSNRQIYDLFVTRAKETNVSADIQASVARVVDAAAVSAFPVRPKKMQMVAAALVLGLMLGAMGAVLLEKLDNTLKGAEDVETRLHQPVLTTLPTLSAEDAEQKATPRLFLDKPNSHHAEAIRTARTGVLLSNIDATSRVLLVTSSVPGEGKTTLSTNLALAHAQTKRTLLIDADMRNPQVGSRLGLAPDAKGLSDLVAGTATLKECLHQVPGSPLLVMPAGVIPPNPLELLLSKRFQEALTSLASQLEVVLIDSPPVELVSDALVLAPMAQSTIYVVKAMETPYPLARKGIMRLQRAGARILGVVVNQMDFDKAQRYYGTLTGSGSYGHGYYGRPAAKQAHD